MELYNKQDNTNKIVALVARIQYQLISIIIDSIQTAIIIIDRAID